MENTITKITPELVEEIKQNRDKFIELYEIGILSYYPSHGRVQLSEELFNANFKDFSMHERNCKKYPYEKHAESGGIEFFAVYEEA